MNGGTREELIAVLAGAGMGTAKASQYVDAFLEYREATEKVQENGIIVLHPRTGAPIENPFLAVRDRALKKLAAMRDTRADVVWT